MVLQITNIEVFGLLESTNTGGIRNVVRKLIDKFGNAHPEHFWTYRINKLIKSKPKKGKGSIK